MYIGSLLQQFIDIPSVTGNEKAALAWLESQFARLEMTLRRFPVSENRYNILASFRPDPSVILTSHCDTVPPFIPSSKSNARIYGRGACDAKGALVAMLAAIEVLPKATSEAVGILVVVGEETDSIGAKAMAQSDLRCKYLINGEPTQNQLVAAQKGAFMFQLTASGRAAHSGYPEAGSSAINKLLDQLAIYRALDWGSNDLLGDATLNVGTISGGRAGNVIADHAVAVCTVRVVDDCDTVTALVEQYLQADIEVNYTTRSNPVQFFVPDGRDSIVVPFGSDAPYLQELGTVLMGGPGDILKAHTKDESIGIQELLDGVDFYKSLIEQLLESEA